ncbi:Synaptobrevin-like protein [Zancudomyces culisetae]|uniref:Synaptobrevin homolog YKT6 n=1 Tax=Zancudomyces culisetae TaxID=1213189 RepID=A0A1R1PVK3_ZANCU|nr:Synaptobrevin-like protein [Zancudomyces culisetae]|eukprot:OMH85007.1 Synaptobrevin-like protein [Zancudomyces culisetae]
MRVYYLGIVDSNSTPGKALVIANDVSSIGYFQRASVQEFLNFFAITVADRTSPSNRQGVEENSLAAKIVDDYVTNPAQTDLPGTLARYQNPRQADTIMNIQQELDETKLVLNKTIESVLERGERLDDLVEKSNTLSDQSKMFYKTAKKTNSCCSIM